MVLTRGAVAARTPAEVALLLAEQAVASARVQAEAVANEAARQLARRVDPTLYFIDRLPNELLLIIFELLLDDIDVDEYTEQEMRCRLIQACGRWKALTNTKPNEYILNTSTQATRLGSMLQASIDDRDALLKERKERKEEKAKKEVDLAGSLRRDRSEDETNDIDEIVSCRADQVKSIRILYPVKWMGQKGGKSDRLAKVLAMTPNVEVVELLHAASAKWEDRDKPYKNLPLLFTALQNTRKIRRFVSKCGFPFAQIPSLIVSWSNLEELILPAISSNIPPDFISWDEKSTHQISRLTVLHLGLIHWAFDNERFAHLITLPIISSANTLTSLSFQFLRYGSSKLGDRFFDAIPSTLRHLTAIFEGQEVGFNVLDDVLLRSTHLETLTLSGTGYTKFSCLASMTKLTELTLVLVKSSQSEYQARIADFITVLDNLESLYYVKVERSQYLSSTQMQKGLDALEIECNLRNIRLGEL